MIPVVAKAMFTSLDPPAIAITVPFNPESFTIHRTVQWLPNEAKIVAWSGLSFDFGDNDTMDMTLLLDETEGLTFGAPNTASVLTLAQQFHSLTLPVMIGTESRPPVVVFTWEMMRFQGVIHKLDIEFLLFAPTGQPKRARVTVSMKGQAFQTGATADAGLNPPAPVGGKGGGGGRPPTYKGGSQ